jgi:hypothetical protein
VTDAASGRQYRRPALCPIDGSTARRTASAAEPWKGNGRWRLASNLPETMPRQASRSPTQPRFGRIADLDRIGYANSHHGCGVAIAGTDATPTLERVQQHRLELVKHPVWAHSSSRRQQVDADPQPSSLAGRSLQGVEVRAMHTSAAAQLRSGTRRGTSPRGRAGAGGRRGVDALPERVGKESIHETGHAGMIPSHPELLRRRGRPSGDGDALAVGSWT